MADTRGRGSSPSRAVRNRSRERERVKEREANDQKVTIDREKTCPLLLRVFCNQGRHHRLDEYSRTALPSNELQVYTWKDATLKELMSLVKEVNPDARRKGTVFDFAIVFPDARRGGFIMKEIGSTAAGRKGTDDTITLESKKFQIGDFIDVAIQSPRIGRRDRPY
ncbi:histone deacetylase complex subunit SAP18-like [Orbicella faveolata]|uniref:histone deacetylase complex subunit SAP18-like n=1 Tax=Orbicella faveolata TaxID=48498 RepID=UPI0009E50379|nr:histone deacetylase complex subunit SAP18-like [Orbicella faveolata]